MNKPKTSLGKRIIIVLVCILVVYAETLGIYHSFNKHAKEDGLYSVFIPPFAWYRSIEMLGHTNLAANDWNDKLKNDTKSCLLVFTNYGRADSVEIKKLVVEIKSRIKNYPKDKYDYVKQFGTEYILYYSCAQKDFNTWLTKFFNNGDIHYQKSNELDSIEKEMNKYGIDELNNSMRHNDSLFVLLKAEYSRMKQQYVKASPEVKKQFLEVIFKKDNVNMKNIKRAYQNIFGQE
jgi:hypothetical protein